MDDNGRDAKIPAKKEVVNVDSMTPFPNANPSIVSDCLMVDEDKSKYKQRTFTVPEIQVEYIRGQSCWKPTCGKRKLDISFAATKAEKDMLLKYWLPRCGVEINLQWNMLACSRSKSGQKVVKSRQQAIQWGGVVESFQKSKWLTDEVIHWWLLYLNSQVPKHNCLILQPFITAGDNFMGWRVEKMEPHKPGRLYLYPFEANSHWVMLLINLEEGTMEEFNSMFSSTPHMKPRKRKYLAVFFHCLLKRKEVDKVNWKYYVHKSIPQQTNVFDCGVYTILFGSVLLCNVGFKWIQLEVVTNSRKYFLAKLIKERVSCINREANNQELREAEEELMEKNLPS